MCIFLSYMKQAYKKIVLSSIIGIQCANNKYAYFFLRNSDALTSIRNFFFRWYSCNSSLTVEVLAYANLFYSSIWRFSTKLYSISKPEGSVFLHQNLFGILHIWQKNLFAWKNQTFEKVLFNFILFRFNSQVHDIFLVILHLFLITNFFMNQRSHVHYTHFA